MHSIWQHRAIRKRRILQWFIYEITESETPVLKNSCSSWLGLWYILIWEGGGPWVIVLYTFFYFKKKPHTCFLFFVSQSTQTVTRQEILIQYYLFNLINLHLFPTQFRFHINSCFVPNFAHNAKKNHQGHSDKNSLKAGSLSVILHRLTLN